MGEQGCRVLSRLADGESQRVWHVGTRRSTVKLLCYVLGCWNMWYTLPLTGRGRPQT